MQQPAGRGFFEALTSRKGAMLFVPAMFALAASLAIAKRPGTSHDATPATATAATMTTGAITTAGTQPTAASGVTLVQATADTGKFSDAQRRDIEAIIKDYLIKNPEVMMEVQAALESKMEKVQAEKMKVALAENAKELYQSPTAPVAGNPKGDITVVEFFDYNCGYCKKALPDLAAVIQRDKNVRVVLKEFPILSKGSEEAAKVALAAKMQGKYWEFHRAMLETQGQANEAVALRVADKVGLDMARIKKDMAGAEVKKEIDDTRKLAQKMGIQGTPHFLVGDRVIPGAPEGLTDLIIGNIDEVRKAGGCKVCGG